MDKSFTRLSRASQQPINCKSALKASPSPDGFRQSEVFSAEEARDVLARTDKLKTAGTFFFTSGADVIQILPDSKIDRRIISMYQRQLWEETQGSGHATDAGEKIKSSISKLRFYNQEFQRY